MADHDDREGGRRVDFEEMARSIHASYLSRWGIHDPAGLERAGRASQAPQEVPEAPARQRVSAA